MNSHGLLKFKVFLITSSKHVAHNYIISALVTSAFFIIRAHCAISSYSFLMQQAKIWFLSTRIAASRKPWCSNISGLFGYVLQILQSLCQLLWNVNSFFIGPPLGLHLKLGHRGMFCQLQWKWGPLSATESLMTLFRKTSVNRLQLKYKKYKVQSKWTNFKAFVQNTCLNSRSVSVYLQVDHTFQQCTRIPHPYIGKQYNCITTSRQSIVWSCLAQTGYFDDEFISGMKMCFTIINRNLIDGKRKGSSNL